MQNIPRGCSGLAPVSHRSQSVRYETPWGKTLRYAAIASTTYVTPQPNSFSLDPPDRDGGTEGKGPPLETPVKNIIRGGGDRGQPLCHAEGNECLLTRIHGKPFDVLTKRHMYHSPLNVDPRDRGGEEGIGATATTKT